MSDPRLTPLAASLPASVPFVGPEAQERARGAPFDARLGANESVFGPSPKAIEAMQAATGETWKYADPESHDLRHALANHHGIAVENIVIGEGIDGLLGYLVRLLIAPGDAVVTSLGAYPTFNYHVTGHGGTIHAVPYRDDHEDLEALAGMARETGAKLVYLANPDNPMGSWHDATAIAAFQDSLPEDCVLVLDEAYVDIAPSGSAPPISEIRANTIRMRTFSKAYGMAGARVGYAAGPVPLIRALEKVRNHFGMSRVSVAGALAALADQAWLENVTRQVETARDRIAEIADRHGLSALPSATNFVAIDCGGSGARAKAILTGLIDRGIFVRMPFVAPQDRCIRVSCGSERDLAAFETALRDTLANDDLPD